MLSLDMPKNSICVGILPDRGERYLDQVYSDDWVKEYFGEVGLLRAAGCPLPRKWRCFRPEPSPFGRRSTHFSRTGQSSNRGKRCFKIRAVFFPSSVRTR